MAMTKLLSRLSTTRCKSAVLLLGLLSVTACSSASKFWNLGADDDTAKQEDVTKAANEKTDRKGDARSPASIDVNPLRVMEWCVLDNFSRNQGCYTSRELCEKAAQGFGMCSGR
jgi:hypothetical protein